MKRYINWQGETVDEFSSDDFKTLRDFLRYVQAMVAEYNSAFGGGAYSSNRSCKNWR